MENNVCVGFSVHSQLASFSYPTGPSVYRSEMGAQTMIDLKSPLFYTFILSFIYLLMPLARTTRITHITPSRMVYIFCIFISFGPYDSQQCGDVIPFMVWRLFRYAYSSSNCIHQTTSQKTTRYFFLTIASTHDCWVFSRPQSRSDVVKCFNIPYFHNVANDNCSSCCNPV